MSEIFFSVTTVGWVSSGVKGPDGSGNSGKNSRVGQDWTEPLPDSERQGCLESLSTTVTFRSGWERLGVGPVERWTVVPRVSSLRSRLSLKVSSWMSLRYLFRTSYDNCIVHNGSNYSG